MQDSYGDQVIVQWERVEMLLSVKIPPTFSSWIVLDLHQSAPDHPRAAISPSVVNITTLPRNLTSRSRFTPITTVVVDMSKIYL